MSFPTTYKRILNLETLLARKSHFLLGPRSTGKSYLIREQLSSKAFIVDLLRSEYSTRLRTEPQILRQLIANSGKRLVVIDEIQKLPILLNEVHHLIEESDITFLLTGSSSRRLMGKHADPGVNLLGGRAGKALFFPLTSNEIDNFDIERYLLVGGLPRVYKSDLWKEELADYTETYLIDEIKSEGVVRDLPRFSKLLQNAAMNSSQTINFTSVASDIGCAPSTVIEHYRILQDTLIGWMLEPWGKSTKRKEISHAKFYLFDTGVTNGLLGRTALDRSSPTFGNLFEQFIGMELRAFLSYSSVKKTLSFWRTHDKKEVDYIVGDELAIEVKSSSRTDKQDAKSLGLLNEENEFKKNIVVSFDPLDRISEGIRYWHWKTFLNKLWSGELIE